ncbi:hypothetical protein BDZ94DRAFT_1295084 [Collybia nuda]|uniref:F-box domain-containing protein n=1 Tax=Collybia nuda TaxID=64659 RepID=A0A9P6CP51_9AGAR|nr:hypothetical protein BDZ94DRAFT_1295084 [Collybia nuda]
MVASSLLPQELIDICIDFLHSDIESLTSCSLVCWNWVPAARFHLFSFVELFESISGAINRRHCRYPSNVLPFIELLASPHNTIAPYIHGASLKLRVRKDRDAPGMLIDALSNAGVKLTKLITTTNRQNIAFLLKFPKFNPYITDLTVDISRAWSDEYTRINEGLVFAMSFPLLHTLSIDASFELEEAQQSFSIYPPDNRWCYLETLSLHLQDSEMVFEWFLKIGWEARLRTLRLRVYRCEHGGCGPVTHLNAFLMDICNTLEDFMMYVDGRYRWGMPQRVLSPNPNFGHLDFSNLSKLHSLQLNLHDVDTICDSLESLHHSARMKSIVINVFPWTNQALFDTQVSCRKDEMWPRLGRILTATQFSGIARLDVSVPSSYGEEGLALVERSLAPAQTALRCVSGVFVSTIGVGYPFNYL